MVLKATGIITGVGKEGVGAKADRSELADRASTHLLVADLMRATAKRYAREDSERTLTNFYLTIRFLTKVPNAPAFMAASKAATVSSPMTRSPWISHADNLVMYGTVNSVV